uniref:Uncharacterized protein n=1 Tax=Brassica campestris TaxID=3711 RepID=A0A3P5ZWL2_BRACM|nr:unnamed protein product [Brassica rapa]
MILREKQGGRSLMFYLRHVECGGPKLIKRHYPIL